MFILKPNKSHLRIQRKGNRDNAAIGGAEQKTTKIAAKRMQIAPVVGKFVNNKKTANIRNGHYGLHRTFNNSPILEFHNVKNYNIVKELDVCKLQVICYTIYHSTNIVKKINQANFFS